MRLWTIQHYVAYEKMLETGMLVANEDYLFCEDSLRYAYDWISHKMLEFGIIPPNDIRYPIWAWYQWEGKRKRCDMRESGYAKRGEKIVQLTVEIDEKKLLLSDFDLFHYPLNYWYLPINEKDSIDFEKEYTSIGFTWHDLKDFNIQSQDMNILRDKIVKSWDYIFDLSREDDGWLFGKNNKKSIQATFWKLEQIQIVKAEVFIAK